MKLYEVYNPYLSTNVRFKVLTPQETQALVLSHNDGPQELFMRAVLEAVVYNLKTDVTAAIKTLPKEKAKDVLTSLFNGCLMLNPGLDVESWIQIAESPLLVSATAANIGARTKRGHQKTLLTKTRSLRKLPRTKFLNLERHLKSKIIGQDEAIDEIVSALKRAQAGLADENRPLGVFLCAGASGCGKTLLAKELHNYLFGVGELIRIDCGEYQHKHENQKLLGSPPGFVGFEEGGQLTKALQNNPSTVILLDEVEKAHPDLWNTFLNVFDEGTLTDGSGTTVSFAESIIILTTNLGNQKIASDIQDKIVGFRNQSTIPTREKVVRLTKEAVQKYFKPEFINRLDKLIVFNQLQKEDYLRIAELELGNVETKLENRGYSFMFDDYVLEAMVREGIDHVQGARGLLQLRRDRIENKLADVLLEGRLPRGTTLHLTYEADDYRVIVKRPAVRQRIGKAKTTDAHSTEPSV